MSKPETGGDWTGRTQAACFAFAIALMYACALFALPQTGAGWRSRALEAFEGGRFAEAEQVLRMRLKQVPGDTEALEMLAAALDSQQKFEEAERCYDAALRKSPRSIALLNDLGNHYVIRKDAERARAAFAKVVAMNPDHQNANLQLARIAADRKQGSEALARLKRVKQSGPAIELLRAEALFWAGQRDAALNLVSRLEDGERGAAVEFSAGMALARIEQYDRAEAAFTRALADVPTDFDVLLNLGRAAELAGHHDRAERALLAALRQRPGDVDALLELGRLRASSGADVEAIALLGDAARQAPRRADVLRALARAFESAGYFADAVVAYDRYLVLRPGDEEVQRDRAFACGRTVKRWDEGIAGLKAYLARHPQDGEAHYDLGLLCWSADPEQALAESSRSIALVPGHLPARYLRGVLLQRLGRSAEAVEDLKFVVDREPNEVEALDQLGGVYLSLARPKEAEPVLRRAFSLAPDDPGVLQHLGRALIKLGRRAEAAPLLQKLQNAQGTRTVRPQDARVFDFLMLSASEQQARRIANLKEASQSRPEPQLKLEYGLVLLAAGKEQEAIPVFRELRALRPDAKTAVRAGEALLRHREYELAAEFLKDAGGAEPSARMGLATALFLAAGPTPALAELDSMPAEARTPEYYLLQAEVLDSLGRGAAAADALNRGLRSASSAPEIAVRAAQLLLRNGRSPDALELLNRTLAAQPDQPETLLAKAMVLESLSKTDEAMLLLTSIERRWPEWGRPYLVHGVLLSQHGREQEARKLLDTAAELGEKSEAISLQALFAGLR